MIKPIPPVKPQLPECPKEYIEKEIASVGTYCTFSLKDLLEKIQEDKDCAAILNNSVLEEDLAYKIFLEPVLENDYNRDVATLRVFLQIKNENFIEEKKVFNNIRNEYSKALLKYERDSKKYYEWLEGLAEKERNKK